MRAATEAGVSELPRERGDPDLRPRVLGRVAGQSVPGSLSLDGHPGGLGLRVPGGGTGELVQDETGFASAGKTTNRIQLLPGEALWPPA